MYLQPGLCLGLRDEDFKFVAEQLCKSKEDRALMETVKKSRVDLFLLMRRFQQQAKGFNNHFLYELSPVSCNANLV